MAIRPQGSAFPWAIGGTNPWWCNHSILCSICSWRRAQPAGDVSNTSPGNGSSSAGWLVVVGKSTPLREGDRLPQRGAVLKDCARRRDKPVDQRSKEAETTSATRVYFSSAERSRSMARGHRIIHTAGLHRESIASGGSIYWLRNGVGCESQLCQNGTSGGGWCDSFSRRNSLSATQSPKQELPSASIT